MKTLQATHHPWLQGRWRPTWWVATGPTPWLRASSPASIGSSSKTWMYPYPAPLLYQLDTHSSLPSKYLHGICNRQFKGHMSKIEHIFSIVTILRVFPISESNNSISPPTHVPNPQVMIESSYLLHEEILFSVFRMYPTMCHFISCFTLM